MRTSGSTCARTGSRTACSKPTKRSSKRPATLGVASSPSPPPSPQSATAAGRTSVRNEGRWYYTLTLVENGLNVLYPFLTGVAIDTLLAGAWSGVAPLLIAWTVHLVVGLF